MMPMKTFNCLSGPEFLKLFGPLLNLKKGEYKFTTKAFSSKDQTVAVYDDEISFDIYFQLPTYGTTMVPEDRRFIYKLPAFSAYQLAEAISDKDGRVKIPFFKLAIVGDPYLPLEPRDRMKESKLMDKELFTKELPITTENTFAEPTPIPLSESAIKKDQGKVMMGLLPPLAERRIAEVFTFGAKKYSSWNWQQGFKYSRLMDSLKRHLNAYEMGEDLDFDPACEGCQKGDCLMHSGKSHLANAGCCLMMLIEMSEARPDLDDRPKEFYNFLKLAKDGNGEQNKK
jgi:hypothetical protein